MTTNRRLFFYGFIFLASAPISGLLVQAPVANPRAMLSLHLASWLAGVVTCAAAAAWPHVKLSPTNLKRCENGLIIAMWIGLIFGLWQAVLGTATMFAGGGSAPEWAEHGVKVFQIGIVLTLIPSLVGIAVGLGKKADF